MSRKLYLVLGKYPSRSVQLAIRFMWVGVLVASAGMVSVMFGTTVIATTCCYSPGPSSDCGGVNEISCPACPYVCSGSLVVKNAAIRLTFQAANGAESKTTTPVVCAYSYRCQEAATFCPSPNGSIKACTNDEATKKSSSVTQDQEVGRGTCTYQP